MRPLALPVVLMVLLAVWAPPTQTGGRSSDGILLRQAITELRTEAQAARSEERLPRQETTFAREFLEQNRATAMDGGVVFTRLLQPHDKSPFVDAYVRWQLLGFEPAWPQGPRELDDEDFENMLERLPALLPNPRSDRAVIAQVNAALARERVSDADAEAMRNLNDQLRDRAALVQNLNRPALELRRWIEESAEKSGHRAHLARLERLHALAVAGWPVEQLKREIAQALAQAAADATFTNDQRKRFAARAGKLAGMRTPVIQSVGVGENNSPQAQFDEAAVYDFEVNEWIRSLDND